MLLVTATTVFLLLGTLSALMDPYVPTYKCSHDCFAISDDVDNKDREGCLFDKIACSNDTVWGLMLDDVLKRPSDEMINDWCTKEKFACYVACNGGDDGEITEDRDVFDACRKAGGCYPGDDYQTSDDTDDTDDSEESSEFGTADFGDLFDFGDSSESGTADFGDRSDDDTFTDNFWEDVGEEGDDSEDLSYLETNDFLN